MKGKIDMDYIINKIITGENRSEEVSFWDKININILDQEDTEEAPAWEKEIVDIDAVEKSLSEADRMGMGN